jgi:hypothetical protein
MMIITGWDLGGRFLSFATTSNGMGSEVVVVHGQKW